MTVTARGLGMKRSPLKSVLLEMEPTNVGSVRVTGIDMEGNVNVMPRKMIRREMNWPVTEKRIPKSALEEVSVDVGSVNVTRSHTMNESMVNSVNVTTSVVIDLKGRSARVLIMEPVTAESVNVTENGLDQPASVETVTIPVLIPRLARFVQEEESVSVGNVNALNLKKDSIQANTAKNVPPAELSVKPSRNVSSVKSLSLVLWMKTSVQTVLSSQLMLSNWK